MVCIGCPPYIQNYVIYLTNLFFIQTISLKNKAALVKLKMTAVHQANLVFLAHEFS